MPYVLGGLLGGLLTFGIGLALKRKELDQRAALLQQGFQGQGSGLQMLLELEGRSLATELDTFARQTAQQAATNTMANVYGLTPSVVAALTRLSNRLPL